MKTFGTVDDEVLKIVLNGLTFSQREAEKIVGGRCRLLYLISTDQIRAEKRPTNKQNGRWYCNAYDVLKNATLRYND